METEITLLVFEINVADCQLSASALKIFLFFLRRKESMGGWFRINWRTDGKQLSTIERSDSRILGNHWVAFWKDDRSVRPANVGEIMNGARETDTTIIVIYRLHAIGHTNSTDISTRFSASLIKHHGICTIILRNAACVPCGNLIGKLQEKWNQNELAATNEATTCATRKNRSHENDRYYRGKIKDIPRREIRRRFA